MTITLIFRQIFCAICQSWWLLLFALLCYLPYEQAERQQWYQRSQLESLAIQLESEIAIAKGANEELTAEVDSLSDNSWVENVLKRRLGVVAQGQKKVYFKSD